MEIIHKENSLRLIASNNSQLFLLGRLYQKFPNLNLKKVYDPKIEPPTIIGIEISDIALDKFLMDSLDRFNTE